jgi:hypothetical protein
MMWKIGKILYEKVFIIDWDDPEKPEEWKEITCLGFEYDSLAASIFVMFILSNSIYQKIIILISDSSDS